MQVIDKDFGDMSRTGNKKRNKRLILTVVKREGLFKPG